MDQGVLAAIRHFPDSQWQIRRLALRDESFRSLCADLADAEAALDRWERSQSPFGAERSGEYRTLVAGLVDELCAALAAEPRDSGGTLGTDMTRACRMPPTGPCKGRSDR